MLETRFLIKPFSSWYFIYAALVSSLFIWNHLLKPDMAEESGNLELNSFTTFYVETEFLAYPATVQKEKCFINHSKPIRSERLKAGIKLKARINDNVYYQLNDKDREYLKLKYHINDALTFTEHHEIQEACSQERDLFFKEKKLNLTRLFLLLLLPLFLLGTHYLFYKLNKINQL